VSGGGQQMNQLCKGATLKTGEPQQKLLNWQALDEPEILMEYEFNKKTPYEHWCSRGFVYFKYSIVQEFKN
jgi:hypothetical protein